MVLHNYLTKMNLIIRIAINWPLELYTEDIIQELVEIMMDFLVLAWSTSRLKVFCMIIVLLNNVYNDNLNVDMSINQKIVTTSVAFYSVRS